MAPPNSVRLKRYTCCHWLSSVSFQAISSDPFVVDCSLTEAQICSDARRRVASNPRVSITSCASICCKTDKCNVKNLSAPTTLAPPTTATKPGKLSSSTWSFDVSDSCRQQFWIFRPYWYSSMRRKKHTKSRNVYKALSKRKGWEKWRPSSHFIITLIWQQFRFLYNLVDT